MSVSSRLFIASTKCFLFATEERERGNFQRANKFRQEGSYLEHAARAAATEECRNENRIRKSA